MKTFIFKILIFLAAHGVLFLSVEQLITYRLKNGYRATSQNDWHDLKNHNSEIVFIGASKIFFEVDPFAVTRKFGVKAEVISQDGQTIDVLWYKFLQYVSVNTKPKEIYVLCDPFFVGMRQDLFGFDSYRSYFFMDRFDVPYLKKKQGYESYYKYIPLLAVGKQSLRFIVNYQIANTYEKTRGYEPQDLTWIGDWKHPPQRFNFELNGINYIDSFSSYCRKNNIECYFIYLPESPPSYKVMSHYRAFYDSIATRNINFRNYNDTALYNDSTIFFNHMHLNRKGSEVFMNQLLNDTSVFREFRHR